MEPNPQAPLNMTDHDAIVTLVNEVRNLGKGMNELKGDIKEVKENVAQRVTDLEKEKLDKEEAYSMKEEANKEHMAIRADFEKVDADHETRMRSVEKFKENWTGKYAILAIVGMALVGIASSLVGTILLKAITK